MKKIAIMLCLLLSLMAVGNATAEKARDISGDAASAYHFTHLEKHLFATDLHGTGNYLKIREKPMPSNVYGHLEQADQIVLLELKNGYAKVVVTKSAKTSPDSWVGLTGWVDADYLDCSCSDVQYNSSSPLPTDEVSDTNVIPTDAMGTYFFCSGAGAWMTELTLLPNGWFFGNFHDSDMGDDDTSYPNGIQYFCDFSGQFEHWQLINAYSGMLTLTALTPYEAEDHIQDGVKYIASEPYGLENSTYFILYSPGTPMDVLSDECLSWLYGSMSEIPKDRLGCYAIYNPVEGYAFAQQAE